MELLKLLYAALGAEFPRLSLVVATIVGGFLAGGGWWLIGQQYAKDHPSATTPTTTSSSPSQVIAKVPDVSLPSPNPPARPIPTMKPGPPNGLQDGEVPSLDELRKRMKALGAAEHAADNTLVFLSNYPSLLDVTRMFGAPAAVEGRPTSLVPGQFLDLHFKDDVYGFGLYLKQGLNPCSVIVYMKDLSQRAASVSGYIYMPSIEFVGQVSTQPIVRVLIQPQGNGYAELQGFFIFARHYHERDLKRK